MQTNTLNAVTVNITQELEDKIMMALPDPLRAWMREEAASDLSPVEVFKAWRAGHPIDRILAHMRGELRKETRRIYGAEHPQASLF